MNEQLQQALTSILDKTMSGVDASFEFMQAELPDVIQQLLMWYATKSAIFAILGMVILYALLKLDTKAYKFIKEEYDADEVFLIWGLMGSIVRAIYIWPLCMISNLDWLKIWIAPKIWLIEYVASLVK